MDIHRNLLHIHKVVHVLKTFRFVFVVKRLRLKLLIKNPLWLLKKNYRTISAAEALNYVYWKNYKIRLRKVENNGIQ